MDKIYVCRILDRDFELDIIKNDPLREYFNPMGLELDTTVMGEIALLNDVAFKHDDNDIIGIEHYRRIFWEGDRPLGIEKIKGLLDNNDIIVTFDELHADALTHLALFCQERPTMDIIFSRWIKFLADNYSQELSDGFINYQKSVIKCVTKNMLIAKAKYVKDYLNWIIPKIVAFYYIIKDNYQSLDLTRSFGYITEATLGYYVSDIAKLKTAYVPYMFFEKPSD